MEIIDLKLKMKKVIQIFFYTLSLGLATQVNAQMSDAQIDSVRSIGEGGSDTQRVVAYTDLMIIFSYKDVKQSIEYGDKAIELAEKLEIDTLTMYTHRVVSETYAEWGQNIEALEHAQIALNILTEINHGDQNILLNNTGDIYMELSDYENAYKLFQKSLSMSKENGNQLMEAITMFNIGRVYKEQANYKMALEYINNSKILSQKIDDVEGAAYCDHEMGLISHLKGDYNDAISYLLDAIALTDSLEIYQLSAQSKVKIADVYRGQKNYIKSLEYYHQSLKESQRIKDNIGIAEAYLGLGSLQLEMNAVESASESLYKGLGYAQNLSAKKLEHGFYEQLSVFHEIKNNKSEALLFYKKYKTLNDSVLNRDINIQVALMQTQFETEKKDKEIAQLNENKALQDSEMEKQGLQTTRLIFGLGFLLVIVTVTVFIGINKRKANDMLRQQKKEIEAKNQELNKLNKVKDKFFSIISHDLKSPFQSLSGVLELMSYDALSDAEIKKLFKELKSKFDSANSLLENLLEWARMQIKETKFTPSEIQLHTTIEEELLVIKNSNSKDVELQNNVEKLSLAYADMNMFKLMIRNLVSNAVKFTRHEGNVEIRSEDMGEFVCISIKDNGVGISKENQQKLFTEEDSFSTLGTAFEAGTGLGLHLCKEFIEMHGGKIWVESEEGKGSIFKFTLKKAS